MPADFIYSPRIYKIASPPFEQRGRSAVSKREEKEIKVPQELMATVLAYVVLQAIGESGWCTPAVHDALRRERQAYEPTAAFHELRS